MSPIVIVYTLGGDEAQLYVAEDWLTQLDLEVVPVSSEIDGPSACQWIVPEGPAFKLPDET